MRNKHAFTLGEILIALTLLGTISALSLPSLTKNIQDHQYRTLFKKAFIDTSTAFSNARMKGKMVGTTNSIETAYSILLENMAVDSIVAESVSARWGGAYAKASDYIPYNPNDEREPETDDPIITIDKDGKEKVETAASPWIITENNMAYVIIEGKFCKSIDDINNQTNQSDRWEQSCAVVIVDVDGLSVGSNVTDPQYGTHDGETNVQYVFKDKPLEKITGDRFFIYIGTDGVTAGHANTSVGGRILSGKK